MGYGRWVPAFFWALFILVLCLFPGQALPTWEWADLLSVDKLVHAVLFGLLFLLTMRGIPMQYREGERRYRTKWLAGSACIAYGALMEGMQQIPVLGRHGDLLDLLANTVGVLVAMLLYGSRSVMTTVHGNTIDA